MERTLTLPLELDWKEVSSKYNNPRRAVLGTMRLGSESVLTPEIGELLECHWGDRDGREVVVIRYKPNIDSAKRVWNTPRLPLTSRLTEDRIATAVDAVLRSMGVGGVIGVEPPWARFVGAGEKEGQENIDVQEHCAACDKPVCFESDGDQLEYEVCSSCSKHICPSCAIFEGEDPLCPECAATPVDPHEDGNGEIADQDRLHAKLDYVVNELGSPGAFEILGQVRHMMDEMATGQVSQDLKDRYNEVRHECYDEYRDMVRPSERGEHPADPADVESELRKKGE